MNRQPVINAQAACQPQLTECPRCKNDITRCDGVFAPGGPSAAPVVDPDLCGTPDDGDGHLNPSAAVIDGAQKPTPKPRRNR